MIEHQQTLLEREPGLILLTGATGYVGRGGSLRVIQLSKVSVSKQLNSTEEDWKIVGRIDGGGLI